MNTFDQVNGVFFMILNVYLIILVKIDLNFLWNVFRSTLVKSVKLIRLVLCIISETNASQNGPKTFLYASGSDTIPLQSRIFNAVLCSVTQQTSCKFSEKAQKKFNHIIHKEMKFDMIKCIDIFCVVMGEGGLEI